MIRILKEKVKDTGMIQKITPFLWFDHQAEEVVNFYLTIFKRSKITRVTRYGTEGPGPEGTVMTVGFLLEGQQFVALNGGPAFAFSQAISFVVNCRTQKEIDRYWDLLSVGGEQQPCGWLKDRYGISWQVVPGALAGMLGDPDPERSRRVIKAMLPMGKLDLKMLRKAYGKKT
jgi:predicted 3-demethylubiquinone-9 3-methyltransferase (glyoxalase superfamily)